MDLNQVTLQSNDVERSIRFYQSLGLSLIVDASPNYVRFECPDGNSTLSLHHSEEKISGSFITVYFEVENLEEKVSELKDNGLNFDEDPELKRWMWTEAHLSDPDGHKIILFHAGENRKNPPWRIA
ncbi:MAG: VOC family protein [Bacteroidia bacterium]|nr:VOC family protein [Bacteroidia bacterium]MBT8269436.1 VOC family protein [Bacteroidia bacterium]NNK71423.1 VOC family protein [Flavobacteriaceae bacterium]NNL80035.1 VOC family protein [Flavobacteriaceae bacterium]